MAHKNDSGIQVTNPLRAGGSETSKYLHNKAMDALKEAKKGRRGKIFRLIEIKKGCWKEKEVCGTCDHQTLLEEGDFNSWGCKHDSFPTGHRVIEEGLLSMRFKALHIKPKWCPKDS